MKKFLFTCMLSAGLMGALTACSDDDKQSPNQPPGASNVPESILAQFSQDYPDARNVEWEQEGAYYTVSFSDGQSADNTAWYEQDGRWGMTKYEIRFDHLPAAVAEAFAATEYGQSGSTWQVDREVDVLERRDGTETLYIIEVEQGETEVDLYFTAEGILVKEIIDAAPEKDYTEYLPQSPGTDLETWLEQRFPGYRLVDMDRDDGGLEVEFIYDRQKYEAFFTTGGQWLYYKVELRYTSTLIPDAVKATVEASPYIQQGAWVDEVEMYVVNVSGTETTYFCIELENRFDDDRKMYIRADGTEERPDLGGGQTGGGSSAPIEGDIETFISQQYPGAIILERDYDDGYLEVEIRHENLEKEVLFNGRNEWVRTSWETRTLPDAVRQTVEAEGYTISDREFERVETPDRNWYEVEARKDRREWKLCIEDNGTLFDVRHDD